MTNWVRGTTIMGALIASAILAGCMSVGAQEKEGQLAAAGFVRQQADTPQKVAKLQALPQNTIVFSQRKKGNVYIYADAAGAAVPLSATPPPISNISRSAPPTTSRKCRRPPQS